MNCITCGAGLPPKTGLCPYCKTLNDIDLRGLFRVRERLRDGSKRMCPRCEEPMGEVDLGLSDRLEIDRCERCLGLFFDPGELTGVIGSTVEEPGNVDYERLQKILDEERPETPPARQYAQCPVCAAHMNRRSQGLRSGVIVDECRDHGVWLDGGELRRIMLWVKSGGTKHHRVAKAESKRREESTKKMMKTIEVQGERARTIDDDQAMLMNGAYLFEILLRLIFRY